MFFYFLLLPKVSKIGRRIQKTNYATNYLVLNVVTVKIEKKKRMAIRIKKEETANDTLWTSAWDSE